MAILLPGNKSLKNVQIPLTKSFLLPATYQDRVSSDLQTLFQGILALNVLETYNMHLYTERFFK